MYHHRGLIVLLSTVVIAAAFLARPRPGAADDDGPPAPRPPTLPATRPADPATERRVLALVSQLGSPKPEVRQRASEALIQMGPAARPVVLEASRADIPEIRARAAAVLLALPWDLPDDPPAVAQALAGYGAKPVIARRQVVTQLAALPDGSGWPTVVRLLVEDPDDAVKWSVAAAYRYAGLTAPARRALYALDGKDLPMTAPLAALLARGRLPGKPDEAAALFRKSIDAAVADPTTATDEIHYVFRDAIALAVRAKHYDQAAGLLRGELAFASPSDRVPGRPAWFDHDAIVFDLFALNAIHGPLPDAGRDVRDHPDALAFPEVLYAIGRGHDRAGRTGVAGAFYQAANLLSGGEPDRRPFVGNRMAEQHWPDLAEREFKAVFDNPDSSDLDRARAHLGMANVEVSRKHYFARAEHIRQALSYADRAGVVITGQRAILTGDVMTDLKVRMHWDYFRAARESKDESAMRERAAQIVQLAPTDYALALEVVPKLKEWGQTDDAAGLFGRAYDAMKASAAAFPDDPELLNNLAWLCANCDEHLPEAEGLARRAMELAPKNGAYWDTAAEVQFRLGRRDEAIRLEERALQLKPDEPVLAENMRKYRGEKK